MVLLNHFFQGDIHSRPEAGMQELMRAFLIRANFVPAVRYSIGWRGLKQSVGDGECWTAKISGFAGVFGLLFNGVEPVPGWVKGSYLLHYFPDPDESLVERCSLLAAALTREFDYIRNVRDFATFAPFSRIFTIGSISLGVDEAEKALALDLETLSTQRTIAMSGVVLSRDGQQVQMIAPGGRDQDFPSLEVASGFFNVLAASISYNLERQPVYMSESSSPGAETVYDSMGAVFSVPAPDVWQQRLLLGYGEARFEKMDRNDPDSNKSIISSLCWRHPEPLPPDYEDRLWWRAHQLQGFKTTDRKTLGIEERPPLIILSGFLGAGKTSFLQHYIEYQTQRSRFVAVIQNEIGDIGLDGKLLDYTVTEIDEGCVCCSLVGNLKRAVHGILESFSPDAIVLETSGLASPKNLLDELGELTEQVRLDAVITVVDALNFDAGVEHYFIASEQIAAADVLILNKSDLASEKRLQALQGRLRQINSHAPIMVSCRGDVNPAMIFDAEGVKGLEGNRKLPSAPTSEGHLTYTHLNDHLRSRTIRLHKVLDRQAFFKAVESLPLSVFRVKGIVDLSDPRQTLLFQYVGGRYDISEFRDNRVQDRFLTFIGKTEDPDTFEAVDVFVRAVAL